MCNKTRKFPTDIVSEWRIPPPNTQNRGIKKDLSVPTSYRYDTMTDSQAYNRKKSVKETDTWYIYIYLIYLIGLKVGWSGLIGGI